LSDRLGLSPRQIQRHIAQLEAAGLVKRIERRAAHRGKLSNEYDLSGLVERLKKLAPEIEKANEIKRQSTRRGGLSKGKGSEEQER
jgi:predicted ArsR family transcriptional regulator